MPDELQQAVETTDAQIEAQVDALMGINAEPAQEAAPEPQDGTANDAPITNQKDFNNALRARLGEERTRVQKRFEESPEYRLGRQLLEERMARDGVTSDQAYQSILDDQTKNQAQFYEQNPRAFYEDWIKAQNAPRQQKQTREEAAGDLTRQLIEARDRGILPQNFRPQDITADFVANAQAYGVEGALAMWAGAGTAAAQDERSAVVAELERRQAMPQPMRSNGDSITDRPPDFRNMSKAEFERWEAAFRRRAR